MVSVNNPAVIHGVIIKAALLLLCWFVSSAELADAVNSKCVFFEELTVASSYYVYNPEYPYPYRGAQSCSWTMKSDYKINLTCTTFELPRSSNCSEDRVTVQTNSSVKHQYCGNGAVNLVSESNTMIVTLEAPFWSFGGRFVCEARALKRPQDSENCQCGWKNPSRIVGGTETGVNEYPMMAGIVSSVDRMVFCGGTIISDRYVLTAAHCIKGKQYNTLGILVGEHDVTTGSETNATVLFRVAQVIIHPDYVEGRDLNDLCILKTDGQIKYNNKVGPACLPFQHSPDTFGGDFVDLLGWGTTDFGDAPSDVLQKVTLSVLTNLQCSKTYDVTPEQFCTYGKEKDSCQMDSGGPVLWQNPTSRQIVLIGVISTGRGCAVTSGLNVRVGAYVDWIVSATSDATYCIIE